MRKVALVTGAGRRIGADIARRLAREGYAVALFANASLEGAEALAAEIGGKAFRADLADPEAAARAPCARPPRRWGRSTCSSTTPPPSRTMSSIGSISRCGGASSRSISESPVFLIGAFAAALPADREGAVVNIIDQRVLKLTPEYLSYTLAKSALWTATRTLAQALAPRIRVNAVGPGPTYPSLREGETGLAHEAAGTLLGRAVSGEEIAEAVLFLARAKSVTGQIVCVDAGQHLGWRTPDIVARG